MTMQVQGLESTLKTLQKIQPEVKKQFFKDAKQIVKPAVDEAKGAYRSDYLSGMTRAWSPGGRPIFPWNLGAAQKAWPNCTLVLGYAHGPLGHCGGGGGHHHGEGL